MVPLGQLKLEAVRDVLDRSLATEKDVAATVQLRQFRASVLFGLGDAKGSLQVGATLPLASIASSPSACAIPLAFSSHSLLSLAHAAASPGCASLSPSPQEYCKCVDDLDGVEATEETA